MILESILRAETMPPGVFKGGTGDLVIVQEYTSLAGESYLRIRIPMADAARLAQDILAVAARCRS